MLTELHCAANQQPEAVFPGSPGSNAFDSSVCPCGRQRSPTTFPGFLSASSTGNSSPQHHQQAQVMTPLQIELDALLAAYQQRGRVETAVGLRTTQQEISDARETQMTILPQESHYDVNTAVSATFGMKAFQHWDSSAASSPDAEQSRRSDGSSRSAWFLSALDPLLLSEQRQRHTQMKFEGINETSAKHFAMQSSALWQPLFASQAPELVASPVMFDVESCEYRTGEPTVSSGPLSCGSRTTSARARAYRARTRQQRLALSSLLHDFAHAFQDPTLDEDLSSLAASLQDADSQDTDASVPYSTSASTAHKQKTRQKELRQLRALRFIAQRGLSLQKLFYSSLTGGQCLRRDFGSAWPVLYEVLRRHRSQWSDLLSAEKRLSGRPDQHRIYQSFSLLGERKFAGELYQLLQITDTISRTNSVSERLTPESIFEATG